jgi:hypothetical protein
MKQLKQLLPLLVFLLGVCFAAATAAATAMMLNFADYLLVMHDPCTHNVVHTTACLWNHFGVRTPQRSVPFEFLLCLPEKEKEKKTKKKGLRATQCLRGMEACRFIIFRF